MQMEVEEKIGSVLYPAQTTFLVSWLFVLHNWCQACWDWRCNSQYYHSSDRRTKMRKSIV